MKMPFGVENPLGPGYSYYCREKPCASSAGACAWWGKAIMKSLCLFCLALFFSPVLTCRFPDLTPNVPTAAPSNLRLVAGSKAILAWDAVPGAGAYAVFRSSVSDRWPECCDKETASTSMELTDGGYYTVAAESKPGGLVGPLAEAPILFGAPSAPRNVHIEKVGMQHYLQWDPVPGAASYVIYRASVDIPYPFPPAPSVATVAAPKTEYLLGVQSDYRYWVAACGPNGDESRISPSDMAEF